MNNLNSSSSRGKILLSLAFMAYPADYYENEINAGNVVIPVTVPVAVSVPIFSGEEKYLDIFCNKLCTYHNASKWCPIG